MTGFITRRKFIVDFLHYWYYLYIVFINSQCCDELIYLYVILQSAFLFIIALYLFQEGNNIILFSHEELRRVYKKIDLFLIVHHHVSTLISLSKTTIIYCFENRARNSQRRAQYVVHLLTDNYSFYLTVICLKTLPAAQIIRRRMTG